MIVVGEQPLVKVAQDVGLGNGRRAMRVEGLGIGVVATPVQAGGGCTGRSAEQCPGE